LKETVIVGMEDHQIGIISLATGLPGMIDICLRLGEFFLARVKVYQAADAQISDYVLKITTHLDNQRDAFHLLEHFKNTLSDEVKERLVLLFQRLRNILLQANEVLSRIDKSLMPARGNSIPAAAVSRLKYTLFAETTLLSLLNDISSWEDLLLKRLVFLQLRDDHLATPHLRENSNETLFPNFYIPTLQPNAKTTLPTLRKAVDEYPLDDQNPLEDYAEMRSVEANIYRSKSRQDVIIEHFEYARSSQSSKDVQKLAEMLFFAEFRLMHILQCVGYYPRETSNNAIQAEMFFNIPDPLKLLTPRSLRSILVGIPSTDRNYPKHSLNERLELASNLATAVWYVHSGHFVHKSIRPENIIIFIRERSSSEQSHHDCYPRKLGPAFLAGFDRFRSEEAATFSLRSEDNMPLRMLYRHPERWSQSDVKTFSLLHDIYSLGVVMLEIGWWRSLVQVVRGDTVFKAGLHGLMKPDSASAVKDWLVDAARTILPRNMGNEYSDIVVSCLTCVEGGLSASPQNSTTDLDKMGAAYMKGVLERLEQIRF
jgi:hypothetical protein